MCNDAINASDVAQTKQDLGSPSVHHDMKLPQRCEWQRCYQRLGYRSGKIADWNVSTVDFAKNLRFVALKSWRQTTGSIGPHVASTNSGRYYFRARLSSGKIDNVPSAISASELGSGTII